MSAKIGLVPCILYSYCRERSRISSLRVLLRYLPDMAGITLAHHRPCLGFQAGYSLTGRNTTGTPCRLCPSSDDEGSAACIEIFALPAVRCTRPRSDPQRSGPFTYLCPSRRFRADVAGLSMSPLVSAEHWQCVQRGTLRRSAQELPDLTHRDRGHLYRVLKIIPYTLRTCCILVNWIALTPSRGPAPQHTIIIH